MSDTLKPCPFCSSSDMLVIEDDGIHVNPKIIAVHCKSCGARGPTTGRRIDVESKIITRSRWNRRTLAQQPLSVQEGWRPIETAPKDGTDILISSTSWHGDVCVASWSFDAWRDRPDPYAESFQPTHWMHLPAAPAVGGEQG